MTTPELFNHYLISLLREGGKYFIMAGLGYFVFYLWKRKKYSNRKIQAEMPSKSQMLREITYSSISIMIFGLVGFAIYLAIKSGYTLVYLELSKYGYGYLVFSFFIAVFLHDTYFYWLHRAMHGKKIYRFVHKVHHLSNNPTPWAAYAFHPVESVLEAAIFPILVFLVPIHLGVLIAFTIWQITFTVGGHLGYEIYPKRFLKSGWSKIFNSPTHHNMHHTKFRGNYGLYFSFWDRWMGTEFKEYESTFNKVVNQESELQQDEVVEERRKLVEVV